MRVLAVDTTTSRESVAVVRDGEIEGEMRLASPESHSQSLLPVVAFLLESIGLDVGAIDGYAVATGPGSFTGLRVGLSTIQGLSLGANRPCVGIAALDVLARRIEGASPCLVALVDAYRDEVFVGMYDDAARPRGEPVVARPEVALAQLPEEAAFIGDGAHRYRSLILSMRPKAVFPRRSLFLAGTLGQMGAERLSAGQGVPPESLRPLYIRGVEIRQPRRP